MTPTDHSLRELSDADLDRLGAMAAAQRGHEIGTVLGVTPGELDALVREVLAARVDQRAS